MNNTTIDQLLKQTRNVNNVFIDSLDYSRKGFLVSLSLNSKEAQLRNLLIVFNIKTKKIIFVVKTMQKVKETFFFSDGKIMFTANNSFLYICSEKQISVFSTEHFNFSSLPLSTSRQKSNSLFLHSSSQLSLLVLPVFLSDGDKKEKA